MSSKEEYYTLIYLEGKKNPLLDKKEVERMLKSKAIWLVEGDNITKLSTSMLIIETL
jgi:hypothetical protein